MASRRGCNIALSCQYSVCNFFWDTLCIGINFRILFNHILEYIVLGGKLVNIQYLFHSSVNCGWDGWLFHASNQGSVSPTQLHCCCLISAGSLPGQSLWLTRTHITSPCKVRCISHVKEDHCLYPLPLLMFPPIAYPILPDRCLGKANVPPKEY